MPIIEGFDKLALVPEEQITDKIGRRVISGKQGTMVYWRMTAGAHAAAKSRRSGPSRWPRLWAVWRRGADHRRNDGGDRRHLWSPPSRRACGTPRRAAPNS